MANVFINVLNVFYLYDVCYVFNVFKTFFGTLFTSMAYSSFCSHTDSVFPAISSQFIFGVCAAAAHRKN